MSFFTYIKKRQNLILFMIYFILFIIVIKYYCTTDTVNKDQHYNDEDDTNYELFTVGNINKHKKALMLTNDSNKKKIMTHLLDDIESIVNYCVQHNYPSTSAAQQLWRNWTTVMLHETTFKDHVAYVVDKNKEFKLCITDTKGDIENTNTMRFVVLHELSHMMSYSYGHNDEFQRNFIALLRIATHLGLYEPEYFSQKPVTYCGTNVTISPCDTQTCTLL